MYELIVTHKLVMLFSFSSVKVVLGKEMEAMLLVRPWLLANQVALLIPARTPAMNVVTETLAVGVIKKRHASNQYLWRDNYVIWEFNID